MKSIDCNRCVNINITEEEQTDKTISHMCTKYNKRVLHNTSYIIHDKCIYPCKVCKEDNYINFKYRPYRAIEK